MQLPGQLIHVPLRVDQVEIVEDFGVDILIVLILGTFENVLTFLNLRAETRLKRGKRIWQALQNSSFDWPRRAGVWLADFANVYHTFGVSPASFQGFALRPDAIAKNLQLCLGLRPLLSRARSSVSFVCCSCRCPSVRDLRTCPTVSASMRIGLWIFHGSAAMEILFWGRLALMM